MFVYSCKASTLKFLGVAGLAIVSLVALIFLIPTDSYATTTKDIETMNQHISFDNVKDAKGVIKFLEQYGWNVEENSLEECEITIPKEFDKVMTQYNEIQKQQGLDLSNYSKKVANRYTFKITNYPNYEGTVYANVITYHGKVIAGDICTADAKGFIHTLNKPTEPTI